MDPDVVRETVSSVWQVHTVQHVVEDPVVGNWMLDTRCQAERVPFIRVASPAVRLATVDPGARSPADPEHPR